MEASMLKMQLCLLIMLAVGFICGKRRMLTATGRSQVSNIFTYVILPCNVLSAFSTHAPLSKIKEGLPIILIYSLVLLGSWLLGKLVYRKFPDGERRIFVYSAICSNSLFLQFIC